MANLKAWPNIEALLAWCDINCGNCSLAGPGLDCPVGDDVQMAYLNESCEISEETATVMGYDAFTPEPWKCAMREAEE